MPQADVQAAYVVVRQHTRKWHDETFDKTLKVADDIVNYGTSAPRLYKALSDTGDAMEKAQEGSPAYEASKKRFMDIVDRLVREAAAHAQSAEEVKVLVLEFRGQTADDHETVKRLNVKYQREYGAGSKKAVELAKEIAGIRSAIDALDEEYRKAVITAATTPTYVWLFPFGTIAAAIVAGIFSDKAITIKNNIARCKEKLEQRIGEERTRAEELALLDLADKSTAKIELLMGPAVQALDKVAGTWHAIAADLGNVKKLVAGMKTGFSLYFVDVPQAIDNWKAIAEKADAYRANAFLQVEDAKAA
jgi:hypothetical protein